MGVDIVETPQRRFIREQEASKGWCVEYLINEFASKKGEQRTYHNIKIFEVYFKDDIAHPSMSPLADAQRQRGTMNRQMALPIQLVPKIMEAMAELYEVYSPNYMKDLPDPGVIKEAKIVKRLKDKKANAEQDAAIEDWGEFGSAPVKQPGPPADDEEAPF
jgi:hypothetical protein